jgi:hypothetical protein
MYNGTSTEVVDFTNITNWEKVNIEDEVQKEIGYEVIKSIVKNKYITTNTGVGNQIGKEVSLARFSYMRFDVQEGDFVIVNGTGGGAPRLWAFIDEDEIINLLMQDPRAFLDYCEGHIEIISESKIEYNENGYGFYPDDYFCLFYRYNWKEKKIIKFKDHEKRRNRLYIDACIMRRIKPDITFQELLYNLVLRRQRYYDNSDGVLTNKFLIDQARKVLSAESSKIQSLNPCKHGLYRVDKDYCQRIGMTPRSYSRVVAGKIRFQEIAKWYDYNKSLSDNLVYAKANGIKVSRKTL